MPAASSYGTDTIDPADYFLGLDGSNNVKRFSAGELVNQALYTPFCGGRLTNLTGNPMQAGNTLGATTMYFSPWIGDVVPLYNGSIVQWYAAGEVSQATTDTTKSPAACAANSAYDVFAWLDGGTFRATRGPAWSSLTSRGTGAGTSELQGSGFGFYLNKNAITNGPGALRGTYLGSFRTNASSQVDWQIGGSASGGTAALLHIWNYFNRIPIITRVRDNGASYTYSSATTRQARASSGNQINFFVGIGEEGAFVHYVQNIKTTATIGAFAFTGIGLDRTNGNDAVNTWSFNVAAVTGHYTPATVLALTAGDVFGSHFVAAVEASDGTNANNFNDGTDGVLTMMMRM